ncbi:sigma-70 family RNA polymerase sigma factor [Thermomonospora amylolytica]|uniref:sigma-70 family RNA polymerase sigma factor n=1 Tax=Thermomonospora amylolytica TaxID=1411117 RepID=UPI000E6BB6AE|nr:sigma-70 family RNA polymerase sigma factor [Thermomonospora amylolytica]
MAEAEGASEERLLAAAQQGDETAFESLVERYRRELHAHCYRMLGSIQDAEDAVQESLVAAWRGLAGFQGRSSLRTWLLRITTNVCLRLSARRPRRMLSFEHGPPRSDVHDLGEPVTGPVWLEPWPDDLTADQESDPAAAYLRRESVELAFVAALQHLPGTQRAVLILREVLGFTAAEVAEILGTTPASVNSALQRARATVRERTPRRTQQAELAALGPDGRRALVEAFATAWERADVPALLDLLAEDARFTMPPLPAWFDGRRDVGRFLAERVFATPWRLVPMTVNGQPGFACYQGDGERFRLGAVNVLNLRDGRIRWIAGFVDPEVVARFPVPAEILPPDR